MAIGRISGPMLRANLERQGVDLSIETDLLYIDVNNSRIGINRSVPTKSLQVDNVTIENNQIRSVNGALDLGNIDNITISGGTTGSFLTTDGSGNLSFTTTTTSFNLSDGSNTDIFNIGETLTFSGNSPIVTSVVNNQVTVSANDASVSAKGIASFNSNDFSVTSGAVSIKAGGVSNIQLAGSIANDKLVNSSVTIGSDTVSLGSTQTNLNGITSIAIDNITIDENTIFSTNTNGNIIVSANGVGQLVIQGTNATTIPSGSTLQRPSGNTGDIRVNSDTGNFEYYDGIEWKIISPSVSISTIDTFNGDDSTVAFTLSESTTSTGTIITLNGVIQSPGNAYNISGTALTFTEAPKTSDAIEIRYTSTAFSVGNIIEDLGTSIQVSDSNANIVSKINSSNVVVTTSSSTTFSGSIFGIGSVSSITTNVPGSSNDTGTKGEIAYDSSYLYICVDTDTWVRSIIQNTF